MRFRVKAARVLDFDIECRPLSYLGGDYTTTEVTAIAVSLGLDQPVHCWLLGADEPEAMLSNFVAWYDDADIVTGHYIRKFDLPVLNGALLEWGMPALGIKLTWDTKLDLRPTREFSLSQESLGQTLSTDYEKVHMSQPDWRAANRLERVELTERRVTTDVRQHQALRLKLAALGMLQGPRPWNPEV